MPFHDDTQSVDVTRTRFAPSPSGTLHVGGVRTALFNWLFAKKRGGQFILRIDDTDELRNIDEALQPILDGFKWLGMTWDEGPGVGGPYEPYFQSKRKPRYAEIVKLLKSGAAYEDGGAVRLFMGRDAGKIVLDDMVRGRVEWRRCDIKDPVIVRSDGTALYNLATVVDDHDMRISHIFRAEEHLSNTPVQLRIYEALEWAPPKFGHLPFVCAPNSRIKLSKRDMEKFLTPQILNKLMDLGYSSDQAKGSNPATVAYYKAMGYLPAAVLNYLALLGWSKDGISEFFTVEDLIKEFDIDGVQKSPASFDPKKFLHVNSEHMNRIPLHEKAEMCSEFLRRLGLVPDPDKMIKVVEAAKDRLKVLSDIIEYGVYFFRDPVFDEKAFEKRLADENIRKLILQFVEGLGPITEPHEFEETFHEFCSLNGQLPGDLVHPLRVALTGQSIGPGLFDCMSILGPEEMKRRIGVAIQRKVKN